MNWGKSYRHAKRKECQKIALPAWVLLPLTQPQLIPCNILNYLPILSPLPLYFL